MLGMQLLTPALDCPVSCPAPLGATKHVLGDKSMKFLLHNLVESSSRKSLLYIDMGELKRQVLQDSDSQLHIVSFSQTTKTTLALHSSNKTNIFVLGYVGSVLPSTSYTSVDAASTPSQVRQCASEQVAS